jgi:pimeloyl-ACP methyl ester carboxylesterase
LGQQIVALEPIFEILPAKERKFQEVIVFVHHYGGHRGSFRRHMEWLNQIGYDCVTFDLPIRDVSELKKIPISKDWRIGLRHIWADRIEHVLGHIPQEKILFTFSYSSVAALMAINRRHAIDVKAWVCDGGPFKNIRDGIENLVAEGSLVSSRWHFLRSKFFINRFRKPIAWMSAWLTGSSNYDKEVDQMLNSLPKDFPILSVRCELDTLVKPEMIDEFFKAAESHTPIEKLSLQHAGHLLGFREEPEIYRPVVQKFLAAHSRPI